MREKKPRRQIEREFGVPIAGEILDPSQWTQTALKKLPAEGPLNWESLFGRKAPSSSTSAAATGASCSTAPSGGPTTITSASTCCPSSSATPRAGPTSAA